MMLAHHISAIASIAGIANAVTTFSNAQMTDSINAGGVDLADAYAPSGFSTKHSGSGHVYQSGHSGVLRTHQTLTTMHISFQQPISAGIRICNDNEIRAAYNLFYEKDCTELTDHAHDWERVIIVHSRDQNSLIWSPSQALLSQHRGYLRRNWGDIESTLTSDQVHNTNERGPDRVRNEDHPKVYVAWSKHAMFDTRSGRFNDIVSQSTGDANRDQDWWYFVDPKYYIRADMSTSAGQALARADWGEANSTSPHVHETLCS